MKVNALKFAKGEINKQKFEEFKKDHLDDAKKEASGLPARKRPAAASAAEPSDNPQEPEIAGETPNDDDENEWEEGREALAEESGATEKSEDGLAVGGGDEGSA
eukprot:1734094-Pyramimonas_sp.AAC.1